MVDFISEVQEELRKDDYNRWLKKYGPLLVGFIAAIIMAASYMEWKKSNDASQAEKTSYTYLQAAELAESDDAKSIAAFEELSESAPNGYAGLSLLRASQIEYDNGNVQSALQILDRAAATFESKRHSQLAQMKAAYILAGQGNYSDVISLMTPLSEKGEPYEYLARELIGFSAKETGDIQTARKQFSYLETIPGVPDTVQTRAKVNLSMMSLEETKTSEAPSETVEPVVPKELEESVPMETQTDE